VEPFVEAIEKMFEFYQPRSLDLFKDGISVPGLVMKNLFSGLDQNIFFCLFQERDKDLYYKCYRKYRWWTFNNFPPVSREGQNTYPR
jgi:hypothetical protein